jgi:glycine C-acetyltransferase
VFLKNNTVDLFERIRTSEEPVSKLARQLHGYFTFPKLEGTLGPRMKFHGREVLNWNIGDYLSLASNDKIKEADKEAFEKWGLSYPIGNRIMSGHTSIHEKLESILAEFTGKEDAFVLNFGYQGFMSVLDALCNRNDIIVYDEDVHASLVDGIRMHMGKHLVFLHNDMESLEKQLNKAVSLVNTTQGGILVVTHGIFGTTGEYAKLDKIVKLKKKYPFRILLNDADGFGVEGDSGAGTGEYFGVNKDIDIYMGTFSKAFASLGAFVAGPEVIVNYLRYHSRSQIHSKAMPAVYAEGMISRLQYLKENPKIIKELHKLSDYFRKKLKKNDFNIGNSDACIVPLFLHCSIYEALNLVIDLRENYNIFCPILVYPFVRKDELLLRFLPTLSHTKDDIDYTVEALIAVRKNLDEGKYTNENNDFFGDEDENLNNTTI